MGLLWKSKSPAETDHPQKKAQESRTFVNMHTLLLKITILPVKKFQKKAFTTNMHSNCILSLILNSHFFQMFTPASFVSAEIFPHMTWTTPCSTGCPAPFHHFFVSSTAGRTTTLNRTPFSFVATIQNSFWTKSNLNAMQSRVTFFLSRSFMSWSCI